MPLMHSTPARTSPVPARLRHAPAPVGDLLLQRKPCSCGGSCPRCQAGTSGLKIGAPNDRHEREADSAAEQVMRMTDPTIRELRLGTMLRAKSSCQNGAREAAGNAVAPAIVQDVLNSHGQPLDAESRRFFEPRFGRDFSGVRLHAGEQAARSAAALEALGYTVGSHIVLGEKAQASTPSNRALLAHELAHVVQQGRAPAVGEAPAVTARSSGFGSAGLQAHVQRKVGTEDAASGAVPAAGGSCNTCNIPGGVGICCYGDNAPFNEECFKRGTDIIDACKGNMESCKRAAHCAQCQCLAEKEGKQYCQCSGIV